MKRKITALLRKRPGHRPEPEKSLEEAIQDIPRITNETVAEHREEVLSSARKYIYPLQHSLRRIVTVSVSIFAVLLIGLFVYCGLALYKFGATSTFIYRVTQVLPFPVARSCGQFVSYESYLFELRHYMHYYETQQKIDFNSASGKQQLSAFRKIALQSVMDQACIKKLAAQHHVTVSAQAIQAEVTLLRDQNRLGTNNTIFADVLKDFWGWSIADFTRELKNQMIAQKVVSTLDTTTHQRAENVLDQMKNGVSFASLASQYSDDASTKNNGGDYGFDISKNSRDLAPQVVDALFKLKTGETSGVIETPVGLEIVQVHEQNSVSVRASHIYFAFHSISDYIAPLEAKQKPHAYIND